MSWLFSRGLAAEFLAARCSDGEPSAPSSTNPIPQAYWSPGKTTDSCPRFPSGMTCERLTADRGAELLMSYLAASHARTSAQPGKALESTANDRASGVSSHGSFARYDRDSSLWKTAQCSLGGDLDEFSETWPRSGSMRNGACYLRPPLALRTCASESGLWPTPTVNGNYNHRGASATSGDGLATVVARFPTATMFKGWSAGHNRANTDDRIDYMIEREANAQGKRGRLNPLWVAWLMGWPIGWTDLNRLETDKFQEWRLQHGERLPSGEIGNEA